MVSRCPYLTAADQRLPVTDARSLEENAQSSFGVAEPLQTFPCGWSSEIKTRGAGLTWTDACPGVARLPHDSLLGSGGRPTPPGRWNRPFLRAGRRNANRSSLSCTNPMTAPSMRAITEGDESARGCR
jgi:hypothetical protein